MQVNRVLIFRITLYFTNLLTNYDSIILQIEYFTSIKQICMKSLLFTLLIAVLFFTSCKTPDLVEPEYRDIRNARLIETGLLQSTAGVDLIYYNPNNYSVNVNQTRGDVYVDNKYIGHFEL